MLVVLFGAAACGSAVGVRGGPYQSSADGQMGSRLEDTVPETTQQQSEAEAKGGDTPGEDTVEPDAWWWHGLFGFE